MAERKEIKLKNSAKFDKINFNVLMPAVRENPKKWARNSSQAGPSYLQGTEDPKVPWEDAAEAAEPTYVSQVQAAIAEGRFGKGVKKAGNAKYKAGAKEKGAPRYTRSVQLPSSQENYSKGFKPFADRIRATELTPRGPKGQNLIRVQEIQDALIAEKAEQFA